MIRTYIRIHSYIRCMVCVWVVGWHLFITINIMAYLNLETKMYEIIFWHICYTHSSNCLRFDAIQKPLHWIVWKYFAIATLLFDMFVVILMYTKFCASICQSAQMWQDDVHATNNLKKFKHFVYKYIYTILSSLGCVLCGCVYVRVCSSRNSMLRASIITLGESLIDKWRKSTS